MKYYQCRMHQEAENASSQYILTGWIEERGAKVGKLVEIKEEPGLWHVDAVGASMELSELKKKQILDRKSLVSITG